LRCLKFLGTLVEDKNDLEAFYCGFLRSSKVSCQTTITHPDIKRKLDNTWHILGLRLLIASIKQKDSFLNQHLVDTYLDIYGKCSPGADKNAFPELLIKRFFMDDAAFVSILILLLDVQELLDKLENKVSWATSLTEFAKYLCPVYVFNLFLKNNPADHELLLDWLVSSETRALEFLLKLIKYAVRNPATLFKSDNLLYTLRDLRARLSSLQERQLFPYNCTPLLKKIDILQEVHLKSLMTS